MIKDLFSGSFLEAFTDFADNPHHTHRVYDLSNHIRSRDSHRALVDFFFRGEQARKMYSEGYAIAEGPDLNELVTLPGSTLGGAYARFMIGQNYSPEFYESLNKVETQVEFVEQRLRHDHDLWHVVSGFDTSYPAEMGVVMLYLAQLRLPVASAMLSTCFARLIDHTDQIDGVMECLTAAWIWGKRCQSFFGVRWEENWQTDLETFRIGLGLPPKGVAPPNHALNTWKDPETASCKPMEIGATS